MSSRQALHWPNARPMEPRVEQFNIRFDETTIWIFGQGLSTYRAAAADEWRGAAAHHRHLQVSRQGQPQLHARAGDQLPVSIPFLGGLCSPAPTPVNVSDSRCIFQREAALTQVPCGAERQRTAMRRASSYRPRRARATSSSSCASVASRACPVPPLEQRAGGACQLLPATAGNFLECSACTPLL